MFLHSLRRQRLPLARWPLHRFIATKNVVADPMTGDALKPNRLEIKRNPNPATPPPSNTLVFGHTTDHMLTIPWDAVSGWGTPEIKPYGPFQMEPSSTVLHYAQTLFEGMKAYRDEHGKVTLFRPDMNMKRMNNSARPHCAAAAQTFNGEALIDLIKKLVRLDQHWVPKEPGHSLYVRPTLIGTQKAIGVGPPNEALLFVILSPVGPYYASGFKPIALYGTTEFVRAAPGGTGAYKLGVNYAPGVLPQKAAAALGYAQNLWLHGEEHELTEVGTMNMFLLNSLPPPLDGMILPGVTRDSVLTLAREHVSGKRLPNLTEKLKVSERRKSGYLGEDVHIPTGEDGMGPVSRPIWTELVGRQWGTIPSEWSVPVTE
ncbi:aminotransferase [Mycena olivaceomarginata]|nr:aminotransferase [Mycena olivaceomarginata]